MDHQLGGSVLLLGGLSLGAQIVLEILSQKNVINNRGFAKLQFRSLHMMPDLFEEYYRDTCRITKSGTIAFLKANTAYAPKRILQNC